jgi:CubicO group peptidase (beta-lactamase class C family)
MSTLDEPLLRQLFEDAVKRSGAFGAQLSIIKGGQQIDLSAGFAHAPRGLAMTPDTLMQIGSVTKVFNAAVIVSLVEEGVLDLDRPVRQYLPEFEVGDREASESLTLRHLTSMCSGLDNGPYDYFGGGDDALGQYVGHLKSLPQHFRPGRHFGYANAGTCIAGYVASRVAHKPWESLLRERVLRPAGVKQSVALDADVSNRLVSCGHFLSPDSGSVEITEPYFTLARARAPSGATLAMSASHLARFGKIFLNVGRADDGTQVLSESSIEQMTSPQIDVPTRKYGTSWCIGPCMAEWNGIRVWGHGGTSLTSTSSLHWFPERQGVMAFIVNTHAAMGEFSRMALGSVLNAAFGFDKPRIDTPEPSLAPINHSRYLGIYEHLNLEMHIKQGEGNTLRARMLPQSRYRVRPELFGIEQTLVLTPLGGDRFLVNPPDGPDKHRGIVDMAFFGNDGNGRATNALDLVFPMSRR